MDCMASSVIGPDDIENTNKVSGKKAPNLVRVDSSEANFGKTLTVSSGRSIASDQISQQLLRATRLRTTLKGFGVFWRSKGNYLKKDQLWHFSFPCERIRFFLSHSWAANGELKFLACLLQSEFWTAAITFIASWALLLILSVYDVLPHIGVTERSFRGKMYACPRYIWSSSLSPLVALVALFISPVLPCLCRTTPVFLDMLCIHQVNEELKMEGISSLAGFLANSDEFLMLWSEHYFSRLWCVFEVAAFRRYRPNGKFTVRPISIVFAQFFGFISVWLMASSQAYVGIITGTGALPVLFMCSFMILVVSQKLLRRLMRDKFALRSQLLAFDCRKAACSALADSEYIMTSIIRWFGNADSFNSYVRGSMREMIEREMFACPISYRASVVIGAPFAISFVELVLSMYLADVPMHDLASAGVFAFIQLFCLLPVLVWSIYFLAERFRSLRTSYVGEIGLNVALSACTSISGVLLFGVGQQAYTRHVMFVFLYGGCVATLTWVVFQFYPRRRASNIGSWFSGEGALGCDSQSQTHSDAMKIGGPAIHLEARDCAPDLHALTSQEFCFKQSSRTDGAVAHKFSL